MSDFDSKEYEGNYKPHQARKTYQGYIVPIGEDKKGMKGFDEKTGIRLANNGHEYVLASIQQVTRDGNGIPIREDGKPRFHQEYMEIYPKDGEKFTDKEKKLMHAGKGYNFHVLYGKGHNGRYDFDGNERTPRLNLAPDSSGHTLDRNTHVDMEKINEAGREHNAQKRDKAVKEHEEWVDSLEKVSGTACITSEPWHAYDKKYDAIVTKLKVEPGSLNIDQNLLKDKRNLSVTFPYSKDEPSFSKGDTISLKDVGMYVNQNEHVNLFKNDSKGIEITKKNGKQVEKETLLADLSKDNLYEQKDGSSLAYFYSDDIKNVEGEEMAWRANQTVVSLTAEQAEPLKKELEKYDQVPVVIEGKKTFGKTQSNKVREEIDLTKGEGSIQVDRGDAGKEKKAVKEMNDSKAREESATKEKAKSTRSRAQR